MTAHRLLPRRWLPALLAVLSLIPLLIAGQSAASATPPATPGLAGTGPFAQAGRWITDRDGRVVITHGVNMVAKTPPYAIDAMGFDDDDAAFLAANGFDSVRVGVYWTAVEPQPGVYNQAYLARIKASVEMLARHGIVSLLDMHQDMYNERFSGAGAPDWAVLDDGLPPIPNVGFPYNQFVMPALLRAYDHFLANDPAPDGIGLQDHFAAMWAQVARTVAGTPGVFGYEFLNEPWPGFQYPFCIFGNCAFADGQLTAMNRKVAAAIRTVDPDTMLYYEPYSLFNTGLPTTVGGLDQRNAGFAFHDYCTLEQVLHTYAFCPPFDANVFNNADAHTAATGEAQLLTEFGASNSIDLLDSITALADQHMVGWQYWAYNEGFVKHVGQPPTGDNVDTLHVPVLSAPHPRSIAGTPLGYGFDRATSTFTLRYSTQRADGHGAFASGALTDITVPPSQYPHGYRVTVTGARVTSAAGAPVLTLSADANATEINVTVTPAS